MDTVNLVKKGEKMNKNLDPIQRADIVREQIRILDNSEGITKDIIDRANDLLLHVEEEEANYISELDYINGEQAKAEAELTNKELEDMADYYETLAIDNMKDTLWD